MQLHHLTPNSILHIVGYIALCEMHLGCEAHFGLRRNNFCVVPYSPTEKLYEVGAAEVCRIEGTAYPPGNPQEDIDVSPTEWFYIDDIPLLDPVRRGLPDFSSAPLKKRLN